MHYRQVHAVGVVLGAALLWLSGCRGSQPSRFYILTPLPASAPLQPWPNHRPGLALGVGPVTLPPYLDRPQIVMNHGANELSLAEFDQWAESLQMNVTRVLGENLSTLLATDRIALHPWPRATQVDYQVEVNIVQFNGGKASPGSLVVRWVIYSDSGREERLRHKSQVPVRPEGTDYHAVVAAMNHAVGELSRDIAAALRHLAQHERQPAN